MHDIKALSISRTTYDWHFLDKNQPNERKLDQSNKFYFAGKSEKENPLSKLKIDYIFRGLHIFAVR